jgi:hypothetical protein
MLLGKNPNVGGPIRVHKRLAAAAPQSLAAPALAKFHPSRMPPRRPAEQRKCKLTVPALTVVQKIFDESFF